MALVRNKLTNELVECTEYEAQILTCPEDFKTLIRAVLADKRYSITPIQMGEDSTELKYTLQNSSEGVKVKGILNGEYETLPDTEASRILYGTGKRS